jgi:hypothetical protein
MWVGSLAQIIDLFARAYKFAQLCLFVLLFGVILHVGSFTTLSVALLEISTACR